LFEFPEIGSLGDADARGALEIPAREAGVAFASDALDELVGNSQGYPYFLQEWGYHVWNHALGSPVPLEDVRAIRPLVLSALDRDFFRARRPGHGERTAATAEQPGGPAPRHVGVGGQPLQRAAHDQRIRLG